MGLVPVAPPCFASICPVAQPPPPAPSTSQNNTPAPFVKPMLPDWVAMWGASGALTLVPTA